MTPVTNPRLRQVVRVGGTVLLIAIFLLLAVVVFPQLAGAEQSYVVVSGSMSPTMHAGDVVVVQSVSPASIEVGDVITFEREADDTPTTHRVVEVVQRDGEPHFRTKGDANEEADVQLVPASGVTGRVWFHVPYLGYLLSFARTRVGLLALVIVPSALLVVTELHSLVRAMRRPDDEDASEERMESELSERTR